MAINQSISRYPVTLALAYVLFLLALLSISITPFAAFNIVTSLSFRNHLVQFIYRLFIYNDTFSYLVVIYLIYSFSKLELVLGSGLYMSVVFTLVLVLLPLKLPLSYIISPSSGCVAIISAIFVLYWNMIPMNHYDSFCVYKSFRISKSIVLLFLIILLVFSNSIAGVIDSLLGYIVGRILMILLPKHFVIPFPSFITRGLINLCRLCVDGPRSRSRSEDSSSPFVIERNIPMVDRMQDLRSEDVTALMNLGFSRMECEYALRSCGNDVNQAAEQLLSTV